MSSKRKIKYKCPFCDKRMTREDLVIHLSDTHEDVLPQDFTPLRYVFNYVNNRSMDYHGKCTECGKPTPWDENKGRYDRQCTSPSCHKSYLKKFELNMMRTRGVTRISATVDGLESMLANRKISGKYKMQDGTEKTYTGKYEKAALEFMDKIMNVKSQDLLCPGPVLEYQYGGKTHLYITDFYYQPYNLIIEVKDGGNNPNMRSMPDYRAKQIAKEEFICKYTNYNYLRLANNDLSQLLAVFMSLKMQLVDGSSERVIHINEKANYATPKKCTCGSTDIGTYIKGEPVFICNKCGKYLGTVGDSAKKLKELVEVSGSLIGLPPVGTKGPDSVYVVNYMQNNVFSGEDINGLALTDSPKLDRIITRDKQGKLRETSGIKFLSKCDYNLYEVSGITEEQKQTIIDNMNEFVEEEFLYETLFNKKMYTYDQIACEESAKPIEDFYTHMYVYEQKVNNTLQKLLSE